MKNLTRNKCVLGLVAAMLLTCANSFAQYTDRKAFNLNGAVKSVVSKSDESYISDGIEMNYTSLTFTRAGKGATCNESDFPTSEYMGGFTLDRNSKGQISATTGFWPGGFAKTYYIYNAQGKIASLKHETSESTRKTTIYCTYDADGNLVKCGKTVYTILKKDSHGNWLSRKYKNDDGETVTESRTITYYQ